MWTHETPTSSPPGGSNTDGYGWAALRSVFSRLAMDVRDCLNILKQAKTPDPVGLPRGISGTAVGYLLSLTQIQ